jgi:PAS domain S-box-containing protein
MAQNSLQQLNILVIDDDEDDYFIITELFKEIRQYEIKPTWSSNYTEALRLLMEHRFDLSFVDYRLGAKSGIDLIEEAIVQEVSTPIIILTGKGNQQIDLTAVDKGAYDYLIKSEISPESVERSIRYALARYQSKNALQQSEKKFRSMYEHSKDAMFILNTAFEIIDTNQSTTLLLATDKTALYNKPLFSFLKNKATAERLIMQLQSGNDVIEEEIIWKSGDGNEHIGLLTITTEKASEDSWYFQGVIHDLTHLKREEQTKLQAEKFEATHRFIRMLAHEVRNPLNNILLSLDSMKDGDTTMLQFYIDIAERNSLRISDLIKQLLESFKTAEAPQQHEPLHDIVEEALKAVEDRLLLKDVRVYKQLHNTIVIKADKEQLKLALLNFMVNAIEAMEERNGVLSVATLIKDDSVQLLIEDNGCGMTDEQQQHLFVPYFTTKKNGVGLGLSATLGILRSHNATVTVQSQVGKGTVFTISFEPA